MERKLLIFDLNGVLVDKKFCPKFPQSGSSDLIELEEKMSVTIDKFDVHLRRGCIPLLQRLKEKYTLAIWSSTQKKNVFKIVDFFFGGGFFSFVWSRDRTLLADDSYETVKPIDLIIRNPNINEKRIWNERNILLIDNSEQKVNVNPPKNYLILPPFSIEDEESHSFPEDFEKIVEEKFQNMM